MKILKSLFFTLEILLFTTTATFAGPFSIHNKTEYDVIIYDSNKSPKQIIGPGAKFLDPQNNSGLNLRVKRCIPANLTGSISIILPVENIEFSILQVEDSFGVYANVRFLNKPANFKQLMFHFFPDADTSDLPIDLFTEPKAVPPLSIFSSLEYLTPRKVIKAEVCDYQPSAYFNPRDWDDESVSEEEKEEDDEATAYHKKPKSKK